MDLTQIMQPFGSLDPDTKAALRASGGPFEKFSGTAWWPCDNPGWMPHTTYRLKPLKREAE